MIHSTGSKGTGQTAFMHRTVYANAGCMTTCTIFSLSCSIMYIELITFLVINTKQPRIDAENKINKWVKMALYRSPENLRSFESISLFVQEKFNIDFQDGSHGVHLGFTIKTISAILIYTSY